MRRRLPWLARLLAVAVGLASGTTVHAQPPRFETGIDLVVVDVVVRDRTGGVVRGLTAEDFEIREDGEPVELLSLAFEEVSTQVLPPLEIPVLTPAGPVGSPTEAAALQGDIPDAGPASLARRDLAGRRLVVLLFDLSAMRPEDVELAVESAVTYVDEQMTGADLVAVAAIDDTLEVLSDFNGDRERLLATLATLAPIEGVEFADAAVETAETDEVELADDGGNAGAASDYDLFNNDVRLRAIRTLAENLQFIEQKKAILYFSAGIRRSGGDNQVELRAAVNAAVRANVALYPVDTRGLQALVPGGDASRRSGRGVSLFSGRGVARQFDQLFASQETLGTLADDTGGVAFVDTNDFGEAFTQVQRDISSYYLLGYRSPSRERDGRYRRIAVRVDRPDLEVDHRAGYYAERDFAHTSNQDRRFELQEQLQAPLSATDLPVIVSSGWFRLDSDRYYVPLSVAVPGGAIPVGADADGTVEEDVTLDVLGVVRDEQGRPVGRIEDRLRVRRREAGTLDARQLLYQSAFTLPPGRFAVKVVVRENTSGQVGSFETILFVPDLAAAPVKVSSVTLSTQVRPAPRRGGDRNPLVRDGVELIPSLTHVVRRDQPMFFHYEVYQPRLDATARPRVRTSLTFYRGTVKVFETPLVERREIDEPGRTATLFQFEVPAQQLLPGLYTCQVNVIDDVAGTFVFPRLVLFVR